MGVMATGNFAELLWPGIKDLFGDAYEEWEPLWPKFMQVMDSNKAFEKLQGVTGLGITPVKQQGQNVSYQNMYQGFQQTAVNVSYGLGATVTREMVDDDQYNYINKIPGFLARSGRATEETVVASLFNNGFSTAANPTLAADGLSFFNAGHLLVAGAGTYRNTPATASDLTMTALEQAEIDQLSLVDDQGLPIKVMPKKLLVPVALKLQAEKILGTEYTVGTNDNDINTQASSRTGMTLIVDPYLTDPDAWFVKNDAEEMSGTDGAVFFDRTAMEIDRDNKFDSKNLAFSTFRRFSVTVADGRPWYGSPGA